MKVNGKKAYQLYTKYWISRHFVEIFGFGFLTNNFYIINNFFKFDDLGDLKKIGWALAGFDKGDISFLDSFIEKLESFDDFEKEIIAHHLNLVVEGLKQRSYHFLICRNTLTDFNEYVGSNYTDNIYGLNKIFGVFNDNVFERELCAINLNTPVSFSTFIEVLKNEIDFTGETECYNFKEKECSI